jgi:hypothetical protein
VSPRQTAMCGPSASLFRDRSLGLATARSESLSDGRELKLFRSINALHR